MFPLNTSNRLPKTLKWYIAVKILFPILIISLLFSVFGKNVGYGVFFGIIFFVGFPVWIYAVLFYRAFSFVIAENCITINFGIIFKRSKTVSFDKIQSVESANGPLSNLFNLSGLNIWTASPAQINVERGRTESVPDVTLWLTSNDANELKNFISSKQT